MSKETTLAYILKNVKVAPFVCETKRDSIQVEWEKDTKYFELEIFDKEIGVLEMLGDKVLHEKIYYRKDVLIPLIEKFLKKIKRKRTTKKGIKKK